MPPKSGICTAEEPTMATAAKQMNRNSGIGDVGIAPARLGLLLLLVTTGCSEYRLRGLVVAGDIHRVLIVDQYDPRLDLEGLPDATLDLTLDPSSMRPKVLGSGMTDTGGRFDIPIDATAAGFLEYELSLLCSVDGYGSVYQIIQRPSDGDLLIITMIKNGKSKRPADDPLTESMKIHERVFGRQ